MSISTISTRILPGLSSEYSIVALPSWAWIWIDEYVKHCYQDNYASFMEEARALVGQKEETMPTFLTHLAQDLRDYQLRHYHYLANDNAPDKKTLRHATLTRAASKKYPKQLKFPTIFKLFKFIPHVTDIKTVWQRKYYNDFH
jgi:hypothetical protein